MRIFHLDLREIVKWVGNTWKSVNCLAHTPQINLLQAAWMSSKMTAQTVYLFIFNLKKFGGNIWGKSVEIFLSAMSLPLALLKIQISSLCVTPKTKSFHIPISLKYIRSHKEFFKEFPKNSQRFWKYHSYHTYEFSNFPHRT